MDAATLLLIRERREAQGLNVTLADGRVLSFATHAAKAAYERRAANAEKSGRYAKLET